MPAINVPTIEVPTVGLPTTDVPTADVALPDRQTLVREQLVIHSDFPLATQHRLIEELTARRFDLSRALALPVSNEPVHVYPGFPRRRAFFVETDTRLIVYAHWGDRVAEDLRHEVTHAYLHSMVPNLPLWLDEGLAETFEVPRGHAGMNRPHLDRIVSRLEQRQWQPDLRRLEVSESAFDMTLNDYADAWVWVHFFLYSRAEHRDLLRQYLATIRREGTAEPLWEGFGHRFGPPEGMLVDYVARLAAENGRQAGSAGPDRRVKSVSHWQRLDGAL